MRILAGLGALAFLYLAVIPAGLIYSTVDSACAGAGCESSLLSEVLFTLIYGLCAIALLGTAGLFADHALRGGGETQRRLPRALAGTGLVIGAALFLLFCFAYPLGGAIAALLAAIAGGLLWLANRGPRGPAPGTTNGHSPNGHRALRSGRL